MAGTNFDITPEELESSASKVENQAKDFIKAYNNVYTAVQDLRVNYKGQASDAFNQRIESYKSTFTAADKALQKYVDFLREYAQKMKSVENDLTSRASSLKTGGN